MQAPRALPASGCEFPMAVVSSLQVVDFMLFPGGPVRPEPMNPRNFGPIRHSVHSCQHLKECADDVFGKDTERGRKWFDKHSRILLDDAKGIGRTTDAIRHFDRTGRGGKVLRRELEFFRRNRTRMNYRGAGDAGCPIGCLCRMLGVLKQVSGSAEDIEVGPALGPGGRSGSPHVPFPAEIGTVRRYVPRHGAPSKGEIARQVSGPGAITGPRSLIRNRKPIK